MRVLNTELSHETLVISIHFNPLVITCSLNAHYVPETILNAEKIKAITIIATIY